jgi:hypothetical protein
MIPAIELGEFLMLCKVMQAPPEELLAGAEDEWRQVIPGMAMPLGDVRDILAGGRKFKKVLGLDLEQRARADAVMAGMRDIAARSRAQMEADTKRRAEYQAARKFGTTPKHVVITAHQLWGQGLTAKRGAMVAAASKDADARGLQALRGHVSRQLLSELEEALPTVRLMSEAEIRQNYPEHAAYLLPDERADEGNIA